MGEVSSPRKDYDKITANWGGPPVNGDKVTRAELKKNYPDCVTIRWDDLDVDDQEADPFHVE